MKPGRNLLGSSKKGNDASMWPSQAAVVSRFRVQLFSLCLCTLLNPFLPLPFSFRWFVLGISCRVPFILISRVWRPLFTFLHLYFGPCSRDVGIYFPALCVSIVHDVCIYILVHPFRCDCHNTCHLRLVMPNFRRESKVTCCQITAVEIWHIARKPQESIDQDHTHSKVKSQSPYACKALKANAKIMFLLPISKN